MKSSLPIGKSFRIEEPSDSFESNIFSIFDLLQHSEALNEPELTVSELSLLALERNASVQSFLSDKNYAVEHIPFDTDDNFAFILDFTAAKKCPIPILPKGAPDQVLIDDDRSLALAAYLLICLESAHKVYKYFYSIKKTNVDWFVPRLNQSILVNVASSLKKICFETDSRPSMLPLIFEAMHNAKLMHFIETTTSIEFGAKGRPITAINTDSKQVKHACYYAAQYIAQNVSLNGEVIRFKSFLHAFQDHQPLVFVNAINAFDLYQSFLDFKPPIHKPSLPSDKDLLAYLPVCQTCGNIPETEYKKSVKHWRDYYELAIHCKNCDSEVIECSGNREDFHKALIQWFSHNKRTINVRTESILSLSNLFANDVSDGLNSLKDMLYFATKQTVYFETVKKIPRYFLKSLGIESYPLQHMEQVDIERKWLKFFYELIHDQLNRGDLQQTYK